MPRPVIARPLQQVDEVEGALQVAVTEHEVLVVLDAMLAVEVDMEQLAVPERLGDAVDEVEARHLLVTDLGVEPDHLAVLQRLDEGERVSDRREEHVAAGLVRLRLEREAEAVSLVDDVPAEEVERFLETVERGAEVLGRVGLRTLASSPEHVRAGPQLGGEVDVAHDLADREAADVAVVAREGAVLEDRMREQVRREHRRHEPGRRERVLEAADVLVSSGVIRAERDEVVVMEGDAPRAELGEPIDGLDRVEVRPRGVPEGIARLPAHRPHPEAELVGRRRGVISHEAILLAADGAAGGRASRSFAASS